MLKTEFADTRHYVLLHVESVAGQGAARTVVEIAGSVTAHLDGNDQSFNWFSAHSLVAIGRDSDLQLTVILAGRRF